MAYSLLKKSCAKPARKSPDVKSKAVEYGQTHIFLLGRNFERISLFLRSLLLVLRSKKKGRG
jgi:hypothetical protein